MSKPFDAWNKKKKLIDGARPISGFYFHEREVWWCSLGVNIGVETDGKHDNFERPVLILRKFNNEMFWGIPLTSKEKHGAYFQKIVCEQSESWAALTQLKTYSAKRLLRKLGTISAEEFMDVKYRLVRFFINEPLPFPEGVLGGRSR